MGCGATSVEITHSDKKPRQLSRKQSKLLPQEPIQQPPVETQASAQISPMSSFSENNFDEIFVQNIDPLNCSKPQKILQSIKTLENQSTDKAQQTNNFFTKSTILDISSTYSIIQTESQANMLSDALLALIYSFSPETSSSRILCAIFPQIQQQTIFELLKQLQQFRNAFLFCFFAINKGIQNMRAGDIRIKELVAMLPGGQQGPEKNLLAINEAPEWVYEILCKKPIARVDMSSSGICVELEDKDQIQLFWNLIDIHAANKIPSEKVQKIIQQFTGRTVDFGNGFVILKRFKEIMLEIFFVNA
ncbi:hypothetical protein SS50377_24607 [Spironucleus salmonicida]|uniref:Uncharacterized protein n=1 Tax=Spironucleus salmonicida TaxID=348837 RepID=V6LIV7_9EUKA|nr:hypothetical protein SS50377_24607 [Spironucleus salmonicida]|eukprot:EST44540.1 Hypothetical protein SS50377_15540 [Spironucleus salmonicida]